MGDGAAQPTSVPGATASPGRLQWQAPVLLVGAGLLVAGLGYAIISKPKPDYSPLVKPAAAMLERGEHSQALEYLNAKVRPYVGREGFSPEATGEFHALRALALYEGQRALGVSRPDNNERIVGEYKLAEAYGRHPEGPDLWALADTLVSMGKFEPAMEVVDHVEGVEGDSLRRRVLRRIVESKIARPDLAARESLGLLEDMLAQAGLTAEDRAWAEARRAEVQLQEGLGDQAIRGLLRSLPGLGEASELARGELHMLLGRAYIAAGATEEAERQLTRARELLPPGDPRQGEALVQLGELEELRGNVAGAHERFSEVVRDHSPSPAELRARLGLAEADAADGNDEASIKAYEELSELLRAGRTHHEVTSDRVALSLLERFGERVAQGRPEDALRYSVLAERLVGRESLPTPLVRGIADANRSIAEEVLERVEGFYLDGVEEGERDPRALLRADPSIREEARQRLMTAGMYYRQHADRVVLSDVPAYADSLWLAGDSYDLAGDQEEAVRAFAEYATAAPADARGAEARFRLAQAYQAKGEYGLARDFYRGLIEGGDGQVGLGALGDRSYVPLAQCVLLASASSGEEAAAHEEAERLLMYVVEGGLGDPNAPHYREALVELGQLYYRAGRYPDAIRRLDEMLRRFPGDRREEGVRYMLADSLRLEAASIATTLREALPDWERRALLDARKERLERALDLFARARTSLLSRDASRLSPLESLQLRNASFYVADCAFDLGDYDRAIRYYDAAREQYPADPASLVAMVQIVSAYLAMGDIPRARTANERAMRFYKSLPPEVWRNPDLPMSDKEWERWLDSTSKLTQLAVGDPSPPPEGDGH